MDPIFHPLGGVLWRVGVPVDSQNIRSLGSGGSIYGLGTVVAVHIVSGEQDMWHDEQEE